MSPWLVYLFGGRRFKREDWLILVNTLAIAMAVLAFRSTGFRQAGYRFSLEFMPLLFWCMMRRLTTLPEGLKASIALAVVINVVLIVYFIAVRP
jgi:hypothetical protein